MLLRSAPLLLCCVLVALLAPVDVQAQPREPREILFVPWGGGGTVDLSYRNEPGCRFGPQSFRVDGRLGEVTVLDPLDRELKTYRQGVMVGRTPTPSGCRDFLREAEDAHYFLAGNQLLHYRSGTLVSRLGQDAPLPLINRIGRVGGTLVATRHDGTTAQLSADSKADSRLPALEAVRRSANRAELVRVDGDDRILATIDLAVPSGNLGALRVIGTDGEDRIFLDINLVERAVPLEVRREVWILDAGGTLQARLHLPTHYFTYVFRDLELMPNGDLYHMISAGDGIHVLEWTTQGASGGAYLGEYPARFREKVHYNFRTDEEDGRTSTKPVPPVQKASVTRAAALATADTYVQHLWTATAANISDGVETAPDGDLVETPDWIVIGLNQRIPYKWGGFDTLASFDTGIAAGHYAGDIDIDSSSSYARGVDCSGFVCRCWHSTTAYSTRQMVDPAYGPVTQAYGSWDEILPGDAIHRPGHVRMAIDSFQDGSILTVESAGSATNHGVGYTSYMLADLEGYSPRFYIEMENVPTFDTITSAGNGEWTDSGTWIGGAVPTGDDDVVIAAGDTIIVEDYAAECRNLSFGADSAQIKMYSTSRLNIYGDFTLASTSHCVFDEYWSSNDAKIRFAGPAQQTLRGWSTTGGSTSFRDVIVDKDGGRVTTDGNGMRLGIQNSLEIVAGVFELAPGDDLEGRWAMSGNFTGNDLPDVVIHAAGAFWLADGDGAHHIRSDVGSPIGTFTIHGSATFRDGSVYGINLSGVDVESGGRVVTSTAMGGGEFECGPLHIKPGARLENYTTSDCWGATAVVTLDEGGVFDTKSSSTIFPASFVDNGTVRYSREGSTDQAIVDRNYRHLEIDLDPDNDKIWNLGGNRTIADTLIIDGGANLVLTAAAPRSLTVGSLLGLTGGLVDNGDTDVTLSMADGSTIQRATGALDASPQFEGLVDLRYTSGTTQVLTGPEVPDTAGVIDDFTVSGDQGVALARGVEIGGVCAVSGGDLVTGAHAVTLGSGARLVESPGMTVLGTVTATRSVDRSVGEDFGGIGLEILADGTAPGATTVVRTTGVAQIIDGSPGILRSFAITATNNSDLDATIVLGYDESELDGLDESTLQIYEGFGGTSWHGRPGTVDEDGNTITTTGVPFLALLTAGEHEDISAVPGSEVPRRTELVSVYPNPFNPATRIAFDLDRTGPVRIDVYDVRGQHVATLAAGTVESGRHDLTWYGLDDSGQSVASGVYFCRLSASGMAQTMKMVLAR